MTDLTVSSPACLPADMLPFQFHFEIKDDLRHALHSTCKMEKPFLPFVANGTGHHSANNAQQR